MVFVENLEGKSKNYSSYKPGESWVPKWGINRTQLAQVALHDCW